MEIDEHTFSLTEPVTELPCVQLAQQLQAKITALRQSQEQLQLCAFWDFDGTLIDGDITEGLQRETGQRSYYGLFEEAILNGFIAPYRGQDGLANFWRDYRRLSKVQGEEASYLFLADLIAQLSEAEAQKLLAYGQKQLAIHLHGFFFQETLGLMHFLAKQGVIQVLISASPQLFIDLLPDFLPLAPEYAYGIDRSKMAGGYRDPLVNYGQGKLTRLKSVLKSLTADGTRQALPLFAAGNSWVSDGPMLQYTCEQGGLGLFVGKPTPKPSWWQAQYELYLLTPRPRSAS